MYVLTSCRKTLWKRQRNLEYMFLSFSIQFFLSAIGCGDLPQPRNGYFKRKGDKAEIGCNASGEKWTLECVENVWKGKHKNCTSEQMIGTGGPDSHQGIFPSGRLNESIFSFF